MFHRFTLWLEWNIEKSETLCFLRSMDARFNINVVSNKFALNEYKSLAQSKCVFCYRKSNQKLCNRFPSVSHAVFVLQRSMSKCIAHWLDCREVCFVKGSADYGIDFWHSYKIFQWKDLNRRKNKWTKNEMCGKLSINYCDL